MARPPAPNAWILGAWAILGGLGWLSVALFVWGIGHVMAWLFRLVLLEAR